MGETIYEAIKKLEDPDQVGYVLGISDNWERRVDHDPEGGVVIILHKVPAGRSLSAWLAEVREEAKKGVQEVAKIEIQKDVEHINNI